ncbi:transcription factor [Fusarium sp. NRRL 52700]|nr:transcription factor [Fusarium sp. NRRL 52700]
MYDTFANDNIDGEDQFLLEAVLALSALHVTDSEIDADSQFKTANTVVRHYRRLEQASSREYSNRPTITTIRANLVLGLCELLTMAGSKAWLHIGLAIRFAQTLRMRSERNRRLSLYQREIRRRTSWACITLDRIFAYSTFRTQTIALNSVELYLPCSEAAFVFGRENPGPRIEDLGRELQDNSGSLALAYLVKTLLFWSPIAQSLVEHYRRLLSGKHGAEAWERYWQSEAAMTGWLNSLPSGMKWSENNLRAHKSLRQSCHYVSMHMLIQHAMFIVHHEFLVYTEDQITLPDILSVPIATTTGSTVNEQSLSSTEACVDGAMQIVNTLRTIERVTKELPPNLFAGTAVSTSASVLLWVCYYTWASTWSRAEAKANSIRLLDDFYRSRRAGQGLPRVAPPDKTTLQNERIEPDSDAGSPIHLRDGGGFPDVDTIPKETYYKVRMIIGLILEQPDICRSILQMRDDEPLTEQLGQDPVSWQADFDFSWMEDTDLMAEHSILTDYVTYLDI